MQTDVQDLADAEAALQKVGIDASGLNDVTATESANLGSWQKAMNDMQKGS